MSRARPCGDPSLMFESLVHIAVVEGEAAEDVVRTSEVVERWSKETVGTVWTTLQPQYRMTFR